MGIDLKNCGTHEPKIYGQLIRENGGRGLTAPMILPIVSLGCTCQAKAQSSPALSARLQTQHYV